MFRDRFSFKKWMLVTMDYCFLFLALYLSLKIRYFQTQDNYFAFQNHYKVFGILFLIWIIVFYLFDLYDLKKIKSNSHLIANFSFAIVANTVISAVFFYLAEFAITPKTLLAILAIVAMIFLIIGRILWRKFNRNFRSRIAIIGNFDDQISLLNDVLQPSETEYEVVGFITISQESTLLPPDFRILGHYIDLEEIIKREKIDELISAFNYYKYPQVTSAISKTLTAGLNVNELSLFFEEATGKVPIDYIDQIWFLSQLKNNKKNYDAIVRIIDFVIASIISLICLPIFPLIAIMIKIESKGKVFYYQERIGKNNKVFKLYKFRSMVDNAESKNGAVWSTQNDPRITKFGKFIRKTRLDELPQLINILQGNMSLVGPRPERPVFVSQLEEQVPHYARRHLVRPGLTGWAQIKYKYGNTVNDSQIKLQYDLYYIKNRSLFLYLSIIIRTIRIVITQNGQ